ncbi:hypothetical protein ES703_33136 [subsurface metagenome]
MRHYYFVSPYHPTPAPEPFDWESHEAAVAEINAIIQGALMRNFRDIQAAQIKQLVRLKICPKCRGRLQPDDDGMKCFSCGLIVYEELYRDDAYVGPQGEIKRK